MGGNDLRDAGVTTYKILQLAGEVPLLGGRECGVKDWRVRRICESLRVRFELERCVK